MTRSPISYQLKLPILASNKVQVPGCEPPSSLSSQTLARTACVAVVDLDVALANIPGTFVSYIFNSGHGSGVRQRYLVFPSVDITCPCTGYPDYYKILKELASIVEVEDRSLEDCRTNDPYTCTPDFSEIKRPDPDPYKTEGESIFGATGILVLPPKWNGAT